MSLHVDESVRSEVEHADSQHDDPPRQSQLPGRVPRLALISGPLFLLAAWVTIAIPDERPWPAGQQLAAILAFVGALNVVLAIMSRWWGALGQRLLVDGRWMVAAPILFTVWEFATAKRAWLPLPYFPPPQSILQVFIDDYPTIVESVAHSLRLLVLGSVIGALSGFITGVAIGWSRNIAYWTMPLLKVIGPIPAVAWLPIVFVLLPTSFSASTFLIALSAWFPVTILTWSGVTSVKSDYYDVARTLGASNSFLVRKVAIPAALPYVFVGLFMGLGATFTTLIVAEMLGVKAGLGWYIQWALGWGAYNKVYASLTIMAILFSGLLTVIFKVRDHFLGWQKGLLRW